MKKITILFTLLFSLVFFSFKPLAPEVQLAEKINNTWFLDYNYAMIANSLLPSGSNLHFDTCYFDTPTMTIQLIGHTLDSNVVFSDRIYGTLDNTKFFTAEDAYPANAYIECISNDCCFCKKNSEAKCYCYTIYCTTGKCDSRTFGAGTDLPIGGISDAIRYYLQQ